MKVKVPIAIAAIVLSTFASAESSYVPSVPRYVPESTALAVDRSFNAKSTKKIMKSAIAQIQYDGELLKNVSLYIDDTYIPMTRFAELETPPQSVTAATMPAL